MENLSELSLSLKFQQLLQRFIEISDLLLNYDTNVFSQSEITELGGVRNNGGESGWLWIRLLGTAIFQSYLALLNYAPTYLWGMSKFTEICFFKVSWKLRLQINSKNGSRVKYILRAEADDVG